MDAIVLLGSGADHIQVDVQAACRFSIALGLRMIRWVETVSAPATPRWCQREAQEGQGVGAKVFALLDRPKPEARARRRSIVEVALVKDPGDEHVLPLVVPIGFACPPAERIGHVRRRAVRMAVARPVDVLDPLEEIGR